MSLHKSSNKKGLQPIISVNPCHHWCARHDLNVRPTDSQLFYSELQGYPGIYRDMGGYFFQFVDQMLTKNRILGLYKISKSAGCKQRIFHILIINNRIFRFFNEAPRRPLKRDLHFATTICKDFFNFHFNLFGLIYHTITKKGSLSII